MAKWAVWPLVLCKLRDRETESRALASGIGPRLTAYTG